VTAQTTDPCEPALEILRDRLPYRIVRPYRVRFEESTPAETMRPAVLLAWLADVAWQHSVLLGFGRDWYAARNLIWLVRAITLEVLAPIRPYQTAFVSTQVIAYRRIGARRESEVRDAQGNLQARALIDWVMTNERGIPCRVPEDFHRFVAENASFEMARVVLPDAPAGAAERRFDVRRRDLDPLDHVNNSVYLDYFEEALAAAGYGERLLATPRRYVLDFASSAARGDSPTDLVWAGDGGWYYRLRRDDGADIFRGRLEAGAP
jgi:acyl-ACP thioesterase